MLKQQRISDSLNRLPEHKRIHALAEENKQRRLDLREAKVNIWKKWRGTDKKKEPTQDKRICLTDTRLERLEEILSRMKAEVEKRKETQIVEENRRNKLLEEKKIRQEKIMRQAQEKQDKIAKKRMLEERWEMAR